MKKRYLLARDIEQLRLALGVPRDLVVYVGDGQSDIPVMLHVNRGKATRSPHRRRARSCRSPNALFEAQGLVIQEWDCVRTDWRTIRAEVPQS